MAISAIGELIYYSINCLLWTSNNEFTLDFETEAEKKLLYLENYCNVSYNKASSFKSVILFHNHIRFPLFKSVVNRRKEKKKKKKGKKHSYTITQIYTLYLYMLYQTNNRGIYQRVNHTGIGISILSIIFQGARIFIYFYY